MRTLGITGRVITNPTNLLGRGVERGSYSAL